MASKAAKMEKRGKTILRIRQSQFGVPIVEQSVDLRVLDVKQTTWRNFLNQEKSSELDEKLAEGDWKVVSSYRKLQASLDDPVAIMLEQCDRKRTLSVLLRKGVPPPTRMKKPKSKSKKAKAKAKAVKSEPEQQLQSQFIPGIEAGASSLPSPFQKHQENYGYQNNENGTGVMLEESSTQLENCWDYKPEIAVSEPVCKFLMSSSRSGPEFNIKTQTQEMSPSPLGLGQASASQAMEMYQSDADPALRSPESPEERHVEMNDDMWSQEAWSQGTVGVSEVSTASSELQYLVGTSIWQELRKMAPAFCQWVEWFLLTTSDPDSPNPAAVPLP